MSSPLPHSMAAAVYRGKNDLRFETGLPIPALLPGEALVRIHTCGVCGTDLKKISVGEAEPPLIFGHEMSGVIAALGEGVDDWQVGDRVIAQHHIPCRKPDCFHCVHRSYAQCPKYLETATTAGFKPAGGGFAQYIRVMDWAVKDGMVRIPDDVTDEEATFLEPLNTVLKGVRRMRVRAGDTAAVMGQGPIGLLFTQLLINEGLYVIGADLMPERRAMSEKFGAVCGLDPREPNFAAEVRAQTSGRGVDHVVVAVPGEQAILQAFEIARNDSTILLFASTQYRDCTRVDAGQICKNEKSLIGSYSSDIDLQEECARILFERQIDVRSLVTDCFPLSEIGEAIDRARRPVGNSLKVVVRP